MECREVQDNLNNYIEGILSSEAIRPFEEHLASCNKCREAHADLKKTISHIKGIEEIESPQWLTQKVMSKVREEAEAQQKKGVLRRIFSLFSVNMPLKAAAAVAIAVTTIYIFKDIQPVVQTEIPAIEETTEEILPKKTKKSPILKKERSARLPASTEKGDSSMYSRDEAMPSMHDRMTFKEADSTPEPAEQQITPASTLEQEKSSSFAGAPSPAKDNFRMEAGNSSASKAMEAKRTDDIIFTVNATDIESTRKEVWKALSESGGKVTRTESYKNKHLIFTEIAYAKVKELNDKLKNIGEVKQIDIDSSKTLGNVAVRIEITGM